MLLLTPGALETDPDGYRRLAENLVEHGTFGTGDTPTAYRPPLYPLLLTGCVALGDYSRAAVAVLHLVMGVATVGLVLVLGRWWGLGNRGAALAALLVACDPILLSQSTQVMTETPAAFLATAGLVALTWASPLLGWQLHCHPEPEGETNTGAAVQLPHQRGGDVGRSHVGPRCALPAHAAAVDDRRGRNRVLRSRSAGRLARSSLARGAVRQHCRLPAAFLFGVLIVLSPWAIRNQVQFGRPIVTTTHGGYTLLLANNPEFYQWLRSGPWGSVWRADRFNADWNQRKPTDELQADRLAYAEAWQTIRREPGTFAYSCLVRLGRLWSPLPHQVTADETPLRRLSRYAVALWYVLEFLLAAVGLWRIGNDECRMMNDELRAQQAGIHHSSFIIHHSPSWLWGLLLVACLTAVHAVFWTDMRMRAPVMPVVALAAAAGALGQKRP